MAQQCYLGVDLGAESGRVMAGLFDGSKIEIHQMHRFANGPVHVGDSLRWNVLGLWSEIQQGLRKAGEQYGDAIRSVGVDTWGVDHVLMTDQDEIVAQPSHYRDPRTQGMLDYACSLVPKQEIFEQTGIQFMELNTLYQLLAMQKQNPKLLAVADSFLMMPDFFHWLMSGSRVVEFTDASTTQCLHPLERNWSYDLLRKLKLPTEIFPEVVSPGTLLGKMRESVASRLGLPRIDVVTPATHDTGSAVAAVPTASTGTPNWAYISSGTWSLMGVEVAEAVLTPRAYELNVTNEGGIDGTYRLLRNIMGLWLVQECRRSWQRQGQDYDYTQLTQLASEAKPFRSLVQPDDARFLAPQEMPAAIADFCQHTSQPVPQSPGEFVRCALESLALRYRTVLGWMEELTGTKIEVIHIVGGGTKNELLNQFTADACGVPVLTGPVEATVLGNLLVQARTAGEVGSLAEIRDVVRASVELQRYEPQNESVWAEAHERFEQLCSK